MVSIVSLYRQLFGKRDPQDGTLIDMAEHGRAGGISTGQGYKFTKNVDEITKIDVPDTSTTYIGKAKIGTASSSALWQIKKISVSGDVTSITFAGGSDSYNQVWDDRASLSYS